MTRKPKDKIIAKLMGYIKADRPRKFKECVQKYDIDLRYTLLSKRRTFLHYAAKHGQGHFIGYLVKQGVSPSHVDGKGDLAVHVAINRALHLPADDAAEVYKYVVIPLLREFPEAVDYCGRRGDDLCSLLTTLTRHIQTGDTSSDSDSDDNDAESPDSESSNHSHQDWSQRLAREFEDESADFYGRYDYSDDFVQERQKETQREWTERLGQEMHGRRHQQPGGGFHAHPSTAGQKRRQDSGSGGDQPGTKKARGNSGVKAKDAILKFQAGKDFDQLRRSYEERFAAALSDKSDKPLNYGDVPWPSRGSVDHVIEVLYSDKSQWSAADLRKFTRQQQLRWHPDKFLQKFVHRISPRSFPKVMERVKEISQALNKKAESPGQSAEAK